MKTIKFIVVLFLFSTYSYSQYTWAPKASHPGGGRYEGSSFVLGDNAYVVAGTGPSLTNVNSVWGYNGASDSWSPKANYTGGQVTCARSFVLNGQGYVMTGQLNGGSYVNSMYSYDSINNVWMSQPSFTGFSRYTGVAIEINGKGYFGTGYQPLTNDWWEYDPTTFSWTQKASLPGSARQSAVGFSINGKGYVGLGSFTQHPNYTPLSDLWEYNPSSNLWSARAGFPQSGRWACMNFVYNNEAYVGCGISYNLASGPYTIYGDVYKYNPITDSWSFFNNFPSNRYGAVAVVLPSGVYAGLGYSGSTVLSSWYRLQGLTSVEDHLLAENKLLVYYSASHGSLSIKFIDESTLTEDMLIKVIDLTGKLIYEEKVEPFQSLTVDLPNLANGNYLCSITSLKKNDLVASKKFNVVR